MSAFINLLLLMAAMLCAGIAIGENAEDCTEKSQGETP
jgi:hypothetical protein